VLMNEPLSGLDPMVRDTIIDTVEAIQNGQICGIAEVEDIRGVHCLSLVEWMK